jgi:Uma2 family endonuclease
MTLEKSLVVPDDPIYRLSVEQYHTMIQSGILVEDDPLELLEGWLVTRLPKTPQHVYSTHIIYEGLKGILPSGWFVELHGAVTTTDSEPEPDVVVVRGKLRDYMESHPTPQDIALVVEVADATLQRDRTLKLRICARAGIAAYWILNLPERQVEVHTEPHEETYRQQRTYAHTESVPVVIGGQEVGQVAVRELLP